MRLTLVAIALVSILAGCSENPRPRNEASAASGRLEPSPQLSPANVTTARDMKALITDLAPTGPQLSAMLQAEMALKQLARVNVRNSVELELAVADVVASKKCIKSQFAGWAFDVVSEELPKLALDSYELVSKADAAYKAFKQNPELGPLHLLEPDGDGCLGSEDSMPEAQNEIRAEDPVEAPQNFDESGEVRAEIFIDKDGNEIPEPEVLDSTATESLTTPETSLNQPQGPYIEVYN